MCDFLLFLCSQTLSQPYRFCVRGLLLVFFFRFQCLLVWALSFCTQLWVSWNGRNIFRLNRSQREKTHAKGRWVCVHSTPPQTALPFAWLDDCEYFPKLNSLNSIAAFAVECGLQHIFQPTGCVFITWIRLLRATIIDTSLIRVDLIILSAYIVLACQKRPHSIESYLLNREDHFICAIYLNCLFQDDRSLCMDCGQRKDRTHFWMSLKQLIL